MRGLPAKPITAPKINEKKKAPPPTKADLLVPLVDKLKRSLDPVVGLVFIEEYRYKDKHPLYTCSLDGCSSAWGTSEDMFNHVKNTKHYR